MNAIQNALRMHNAGLAVFPVPYGYKTHAAYLQAQGVRGWPFAHGLFQLSARLDERAIGKVFEGRTNIAVALKGNLCALDCETHAAAARVREALAARGIPRYGWHTARGAHFLLRIRGAVKVHSTPAYSGKNNPTKHMDSIEVRGAGGYVVAAGSLHPSGAIYRWFADCADNVPTIDGALDFLTAHDGTPYALNVTMRGEGKAKAYLEGGRVDEGARNHALFTAVMSLRGQGVTLDEALTRLLPAAVNRDGLSEREARATIRSVYKRESAQGGQRAQRDNAGIAALEAFAQGYDWKTHGRARHTDKAVFMALIQRARATDSATIDKHGIRASTREIAGTVRVSRQAAANALHRLIEHGLIERASAQGNPDNASSACAYRFCEGVAKVDRVTAVVEVLRTSVNFSDTSTLHPDMLEALALGRVGAAIYAALAEHATQSDTGLTAREIAARVGVHRQTVYRLLADDAKLLTRGFVECIEHDTPRRYTAHDLSHVEQLERVPEGQQAARARRKSHNQERVRYLEHTARVWRERYDRENLYAHDTAQLNALGALHAGALAVPADTPHDTARAQGALPDAPPVPVEESMQEPLLSVGVSLGGIVRAVDDGGDTGQESARADYVDAPPVHGVNAATSKADTAQDEAWGVLWARFNRAWMNTQGRVNSAAKHARKREIAFDAQGLRGQLAHAQALINTDSAAAFAIVDEVNAGIDALHDALKAMKHEGNGKPSQRGELSQARSHGAQTTLFDEEAVNHVTTA